MSIEFKQGQRLVIPVEVVHEPDDVGESVGVAARGCYIGRFSQSLFELPPTTTTTEVDGIELAAARAEIRILQDHIRDLVTIANAQAFQYFELLAKNEAAKCG